MKDIRQTPEYAKYLTQLGWKPEKIGGIFCSIRKIPILGNIVKVQRPTRLTQKFLKMLITNRRFFMILIEPENSRDLLILKKFHFREHKEPYIPSKTLEIDLTKPLDKILGKIKKDARYCIRKAENIELKKVNNFAEFRNAWKKSVPFRRYVPSINEIESLASAFEGNTLALISKDMGAGAFFINSGDKAYYWYGFVGKEGRKTHAQYKILWEGIKWAKESQAKIFDFEGIYDERFPNKAWLGFTHFKKSFGGETIIYPGAFMKWWYQ